MYELMYELMYDSISNLIGLSFVVLCGLLLLVTYLQNRALPPIPPKRPAVRRSLLLP